MSEFSRHELLQLVNALCEETATAAEVARLEELVINHPGARKLYLEAMELHGLLYWDAAGLGAIGSGAISVVAEENALAPLAGDEAAAGRKSRFVPRPLPVEPQPRRVRRLREILTGLAVLVILKLGFAYFQPDGPQIAHQDPKQPAILSEPSEEMRKHSGAVGNTSELGQRDVPGVQLPSFSKPAPEQASRNTPRVDQSQATTNVAAAPSQFKLTSDSVLIGRINNRLRDQWSLAEVAPAPKASDSEWVRRTYLDLTGRIPTPAEAETYFQKSDPRKQQELVDTLLASREFSRNMATIWTNLLVGRSRDLNIQRDSLFSWIEEQFVHRRPWRETVTELIAARGTAKESGPANYLLAHLNNEAVPATAITSRIFLCEQLQCTQCHQHPNVKSWGQERFWELNAFFQQAQIRPRRTGTPGSNKMQEVPELVDADRFSPTYYESLRGVMQVAYPKYGGVEIEKAESAEPVALREELAKLLFADSSSQPARAFVNRTWAQLTGYGFTNPVDDMGPHTLVSHPELLEDLTTAFVQSDYDVHRLVRWICLSDAYQLSSRIVASNEKDAPESGEPPLFSRMYVKKLSAEQLFDSLRIAAGFSPRQLSEPITQRQRDAWIGQFYSAIETEENSEASTFDGTLPQALIMMNGDLVKQATTPREGHVLMKVLAPHGLSEQERIKQLSLAALSRYPSNEELNQLRDLLRRTVRQRVAEENIPAQLALAEGLKDVYWAYLNSSEFALNH